MATKGPSSAGRYFLLCIPWVDIFLWESQDLYTSTAPSPLQLRKSFIYTHLAASLLPNRNH